MKWLDAAGILTLTLTVAAFGARVRPWILQHFFLFIGVSLFVAVGFLWLLWRRMPLNGHQRRGVVWGIIMRLIGSLAVLVMISWSLNLKGSGNARVEWIHWIVFAFLGGWWFARWRGAYRVIGTFMIAFIMAIMDELFQALLPYRIGDVRDVFLDACAWLIGAWWASVFFNRTNRTILCKDNLGSLILVWGAGLALFWLGWEWFFGLYPIPYPSSNPIVILYGRTRDYSERDSPKLHGFPLLNRLSLRHEMQRDISFVHSLPAPCRSWGEAAFRWRYLPHVRLDPRIGMRPKVSCSSVRYNANRRIWLTLSFLWLGGFPLWLFRHAPFLGLKIR